MGESIKSKESATPERKTKYSPYEPAATELVKNIQAGIDEEKNRENLAALLFPFVERKAKLLMYKMYNEEDIYDAIQEIMGKHILSDRDGWKGKNNHHYKPYVYKYDPERSSKHFDVSENCFCGYLDAVLWYQFQYWYRNLPDVIRVKEKVFNKETGKYENKRRHIRCTISMDANNPDDEGHVYESSRIANEAAVIAYIDPIIEPEVEALLQAANAEFDKEAAFVYRDFFDHVNSLDEFSKKERAVHERGLMVFHMIFAIERFPSVKKERVKSGDPDTYFDETLPERPKSFRELAIKKWANTLEEVVSYQNDDYQLVLHSEIDFLNKLRIRIKSKDISIEQFLLSKSDIINKAYGWNGTIEGRVKNEFASIPGKLSEARRKTFNAIMEQRIPH